ncbi:MAG: redoxin domain-containing protein [Chitinophagales bacterium]|nr:redoxin domain-containing protein [Chitinophagales bacterium]
MDNLYGLKVKEISGKEKSLADYQGKVLLIVNTASKCGFTPQFKDLEALYKDYQDKEFEILGFPSNQFQNQEPLEGEKLSEFCEINYGVTFKIFDKIDVKGESANPLFKYLSDKDLNGRVNSSPKWNFHKYLVNKKGEVVDYFYTTTNPNSNKVRKAIDKLLEE